MSDNKKRKSIVLFSSDDWGWKTSKYQVSTRLSGYSKVLFVSSVGFRSVKVNKSDASRIVRKLKSFLKGIRKIDNNLYVMTPIVLPGKTTGLLGWLNKVFFKLQLFIYFQYLGLQNPIPVVFSQNWLNYIRNSHLLDMNRLVYYCVDEHSAFDGVDKRQFQKDDEELTKKANNVFCSAKSLYEKKVKINKAAQYFPHGVDYNLFKKGISSDLKKPDDLANIDGPILLFFGHISYDWVDVKLLEYIATERSDWSIVLLGRFSVDNNFLSGFSNIHYLGEKDIAELPAYCSYSDVGIIPFVNTPLTQNCNPLKLPEYLSAGLPVVSTYIPEVVNQPFTCVAETYSEFVDCCSNAISKNTIEMKRERSHAMESRSWDSKVESFFNDISK